MKFVIFSPDLKPVNRTSQVLFAGNHHSHEASEVISFKKIHNKAQNQPGPISLLVVSASSSSEVEKDQIFRGHILSTIKISAKKYL